MWVKLDDRIFQNRKILHISKNAKLLYLSGLAQAGCYLTDGALTPELVRVAAALVDVRTWRKAAAELVTADLWENTETGFQIHDYLEFQPNAEKVIKTRADAAQRRNGKAQKEIEDELLSDGSRDPSHAASRDPSHASRIPYPVPLPATPAAAAAPAYAPAQEGDGPPALRMVPARRPEMAALCARVATQARLPPHDPGDLADVLDAQLKLWPGAVLEAESLKFRLWCQATGASPNVLMLAKFYDHILPPTAQPRASPVALMADVTPMADMADVTDAPPGDLLYLPDGDEVDEETRKQMQNVQLFLRATAKPKPAHGRRR